jgi:hypothetical protein
MIFSIKMKNNAYQVNVIGMVSPVVTKIKADKFRAVIAFVFGAIIGLCIVSFLPLELNLQMRTDRAGSVQFYVDTGVGFSEAQSKRLALSESPTFLRYVTRIRAQGVHAVRIDPLDKKGSIEIIGFSVKYLFWSKNWQGLGELKDASVSGASVLMDGNEGILSIKATGDDPSLVFSSLDTIRNWQLAMFISGPLTIGLAFAMISLLVSRERLWGLFFNKNFQFSIVLAAAFFLRMHYWAGSLLSSFPGELHNYLEDEETYFQVAQYILNHGLNAYFNSENSIIVTPINPLYLALTYKIFGSIDVIRFLNVLFSVVAVALVFKTADILFDRWVAITSAIICAFYAPLIEYSPTLMTEPLFLPLFLAAIYFMVNLVESKDLGASSRDSILAGIFITLAMLTRSILLVFPLYLLLFFMMLDFNRIYRSGAFQFFWLKKFCLVIFLPIFLVGIVIAKNYLVFDRIILATGSGSSLWLGSRADTEGDDPLTRRKVYGVKEIVGEENPLSVEGDAKLQEAGKANIVDHPAIYSWWAIKKVGRLLVGNNLVWFESYDNLNNWLIGNDNNGIRAVIIVIQVIASALIAVYGVIGFLIFRKLLGNSVILGGIVFYFIVFSVPFLVIQRYGLPVRMVLVIPAAAVLTGAVRGLPKCRLAMVFGLPFIFIILLNILF